MAKHGKKFQEAQKKVNPVTNYAPKDAIRPGEETSITKLMQPLRSTYGPA
jgi:ribosomal protein L1